MPTSATSSAAPLFTERLSVPRTWHLYTPIFAVLFGGESLLTSHNQTAIEIIIGFWVLAEVVLWSLGRRRVIVADGKVQAANWRLPVDRIRGVAPLDAAAMRAEQRRRDNEVYHCTAPWIRTGVLLDVDDPEDMPLWLLSTRNPAGLVRALAHSATTAPTPSG